MDERAVKAADEEEISEGARIQVVTETSGCLPFNQKALQRYILHCAQNSEVIISYFIYLIKDKIE